MSIRRRLRRVACPEGRVVARLVPIVGIVACTAIGPELPPPGGEGPAAPRVVVSRRAAWVVFPVDTTGTWGWPASDEAWSQLRYGWLARVEAPHGPRSLGHEVREQAPHARRFGSLRELAAAGEPGLCVPGMIRRCDSRGMRTRVDGSGRLIVELRDSARVDSLFMLRPAWVSLDRYTPHGNGALRRDSVRVEYVAPQLPLPDPARLASAAEARRRYDVSINRVTRSISGGYPPWSDTIWTAVGDSLRLGVLELHCTWDVCTARGAVARDSGWSVSDPSVARVAVPRAPRADSLAEFVSFGPPDGIVLHALRPGRATLRVHGLHGAADTATRASRPARELELAVLVTRPVVRVAIEPRPDTVRVGESLVLRVRVIDDRGMELPDAPVVLRLPRATRIAVQPAAIPVRFEAADVGRQRIVAEFGRRSDTLEVVVAPARR